MCGEGEAHTNRATQQVERSLSPKSFLLLFLPNRFCPSMQYLAGFLFWVFQFGQETRGSSVIHLLFD